MFGESRVGLNFFEYLPHALGSGLN
jgi:hypothetical protein